MTEQESKQWFDKHIQTIKSSEGDFYVYVRLYDGMIFAIGDEWGREGGDLATIEYGGYDGIAKKIKEWNSIDIFKYRKGLIEYEQALLVKKIKDLHIISDGLYNRMCEESKDLTYYCWFYKKKENPESYDMNKEIERWLDLHIVNGDEGFGNTCKQWCAFIINNFLNFNKLLSAHYKKGFFDEENSRISRYDSDD